MNGPLGAAQVWEVNPGKLGSVCGPVFTALRATGAFGRHSATRELRLWCGSRCLDYHVALDAAEGCGVFAIRFPVGLSGRVSAGIPFGVEPREHFDKEPFRGESFVQGYPAGYYATRWTDVSSSSSGYTLICPSGAHTGYAFLPQQQALEFILLRVRPLTPGLWGQMHPSIKGTGHHAFACSLVPHAGTWREAASYRDALEAHVPLLAFSPGLGLRRVRPGKGPAANSGAAADQASLIEVTPASVVLSTPAPLRGLPKATAREVELRLYETAGRLPTWRSTSACRSRQCMKRISSAGLTVTWEGSRWARTGSISVFLPGRSPPYGCVWRSRAPGEAGEATRQSPSCSLYCVALPKDKPRSKWSS